MIRRVLSHHLSSVKSLFRHLLTLPVSAAGSFRASKKPVRRSVQLNIENMEDRIVPTTSSILYSFSDDGGVLSSGLNRTITVGQSLVVDADVAASVGGSPSPESPSPTGTVTFTLSSDLLQTYTIGTATLQSVETGVGGAALISADLPVAAGTYDLNLSYSGDSHYSTSSASDIASITMQAATSSVPPDLGSPSTGRECCRSRRG